MGNRRLARQKPQPRLMTLSPNRQDGGMIESFTRAVFRGRFFPVLVGAAVATGSPAPAAAPLPPKVEFNRDIRPILSDACFQCHGPDKAKRKAKLRLDTEEGAFAKLGDSRAIVPGDPAHSEVFRSITAEDEAERMPPQASGRTI